MSSDEVAKAFVQHFYTTFDSGVDALAGLYVSFSKMTFYNLFYMYPRSSLVPFL